MSSRMLLVDDEQAALDSIETALNMNGFTDVVCLSDGREVLDGVREHEAVLVLLDLALPHVSGEDLLVSLSREHPEVPVIVITGTNNIDTAVRCMTLGAFDYMVKPIEETRLVTGIRRAMDFCELVRENAELRSSIYSDEIKNPDAFSEIVTQNSGMHSVFLYVEAIATTSQPVLITGETGVGKELVARALHSLSNRDGDFVPVNVAGLDDTMFSDSLFGHAKGAFTGAVEPRSGLVETAKGGTLFLDEIGDLEHTSQVKLLRLLQEHEYMRLGEDSIRKTDARIVVATQQDLSDAAGTGSFRKDLYYRLRHHHVHIPPLRSRLADDLPVLVGHFISRAAEKLGKKRPTPPKEMIRVLSCYDFPGNVRELEAMIFDCVSRHKSRVMSIASIKQYIASRSGGKTAPSIPEQPTPESIRFPYRLPSLKESADQVVNEAMRRARGNQSMAASLLGISQQALSQRLKKSAIKNGW